MTKSKQRRGSKQESVMEIDEIFARVTVHGV